MNENRWRWLVTPALALFLGAFLPALITFSVMSFHPAAGPGRLGDAWTLENYRKILTSALYQRALLRTAAMAGMTVVWTLIVGLPLAYLVVRYPTRLVHSFYSMLYVSSLTSIVIRGLGWITMLGTNGPINRLLLSIGLVNNPIEFTGTLLGATIGMVHYQLPFMVLTLIPVVQMIDPVLEEAAAGMGSPQFTTLRRIVIPLAVPGIIAGSLMVFASSMGAFVIPRMLGGPLLNILSILIDQQVLTTFNYALGAGLAFLVLILVIVLVTLTNLVLRGRAYQS